jgi:hypothetical protein
VSLSRRLVEYRLRGVSRRLVAARNDLQVVTEQAAALTDEADDLDIRALVSESPAARHEAGEASGHRAAMQRERTRLVALIERLSLEQDRLLDRLGPS